MLQFDRYVGRRSRVLDLTSGRFVDLERAQAKQPMAPELFCSQEGRTLIDVESTAHGRIEVWEDWVPRRTPRQLEDTIVCFNELLETARLGAPRGFDLSAARPADADYLRRVLAREARVRGWVPIAADLLGRFSRRHRARWPEWLADRSLVVFADRQRLSADVVGALLKLARRDARPHILVRTPASREEHRVPRSVSRLPAEVHEDVARFGTNRPPVRRPGPTEEAAARWALLLEDVASTGNRDARALDLADVLVAREHAFEAGALLARTAQDDGALAARRREVGQRLTERAMTKMKGWDMVDDFVGVLQICQDVEDEQAALARVSAYVRERLQASAVAFVARESHGPRVMTRVGAEMPRVDLAVRSIETGVAIPAGKDEGPVESACPIRHAAEVIGALWCRWSAGMPVAPTQAATLLGVAAAAAAPSLRLAIARRQVATPAGNPVPELVGQSAVMTNVRDAIVRAAGSPFPVVIEGESGSGKELAARAIHAHGQRRDKRFCAINCAALVDDLVEAELFGHTRGAFTGAHAERAGLFEEANGGTLFLDEVAELSAKVQAKLLRVLQEGEVRRVGESHLRRVDVRIVAATNRPLAIEVQEGRFRKDLWYRLDVIRVSMPPLRSRLEDLPLLASHLWTTLATRTGSKAVLSPAAMAALAMYDWPGNVRELQNVLASLLVSSPPTGLVSAAALPGHIARAAAIGQSPTLDAARRQFEERYVRAALARAGGKALVAARELGLTRQGMTKLMGRLGIEAVRPES